MIYSKLMFVEKDPVAGINNGNIRNNRQVLNL